MLNNTYTALITEAYRGELLAKYALAELRRLHGTTWRYYGATHLLERLEEHMASVLFPLLQKYQLDFPNLDVLAQEGRHATTQFGDWPQMMSYLRAVMPAIVTKYDALAETCDPYDRPILELFAEHERALLKLAQAELISERAQTIVLGHISQLIEQSPPPPINCDHPNC